MTQNVMSELYRQGYPQAADANRAMNSSYLDDHIMSDVDTTMTGDEGAQTLDQIISQNDRELERQRSSYSHPNYPSNHNNSNNNNDSAAPPAHTQRSPVVKFASAQHPDSAPFDFGPDQSPSTMRPHMSDISTSPKAGHRRSMPSRENLRADSHLQQQLQNVFTSLPDYPTAIMTNNTNGGGSTAALLPSSMDISTAFDNNPAGPAAHTGPIAVPTPIEQSPMFSASSATSTRQPFASVFSPIGQDSPSHRGHHGLDQSLMDRVSQMRMPDSIQSMSAMRPPPREIPRSNMPSSGTNHGAMPPPLPHHQHLQQQQQRQQPPPPPPPPPLPQQPHPPAKAGMMAMRANGPGQELAFPDPRQGRPPDPQFVGIYARSGFDMLGILSRVTTRPNPEINVGPVDLSCAFVVCDMTLADLPIVYCSENFERLTGYANAEIVGRNCRFLQSPDGHVQAGERRKYVDDHSVFTLKNKLRHFEEIQLSLINYRKGGQPFNNLLTMIPVSWDSMDCKFYVGFQVDLVEQPGSVAGRNPDGTYAINYQRCQLPPYVLRPPDANLMQGDMGQSIGRDEVSTVLSTIGAGESELSKRVWDKVLLENVDDIVHVLSLKGLFLYLSPASRRVLEYDASELVGTSLSSVCHPSDIVPVTRELKDTAGGSPVNVVFRIRRKRSGYTWFESHGCLHTEQGKGRKCIIMVGRERPVYAVSRSEVVAGGGIGDAELWTKMSTSGMFLFVSSNSRMLLDRPPTDLVGTSIQAMMRTDSKNEFNRLLELARAGKRSLTCKHEMQNRRGQVLQAQTSLYPGDAEEGSKPTFLVAQTRFARLPRSTVFHSGSNHSNSTTGRTTGRPDGASADSATPSTSGGPTGTTPQRDEGAALMVAGPAGAVPFGPGLSIGNQDEALASEDNIFEELKTTRNTSWQFELRQMERQNRILGEELQGLLSRKKKRKRRKAPHGQPEKDCANCHTRMTPEWRRGPSGRRDLCNSCGLRWAKQNGRMSPRKTSGDVSDKASNSPSQASPLNGAAAAAAATSSATAPTGTGEVALAANSASAALSGTKRTPQTDPPPTSTASIPPKIEEDTEPPHSDVLPT